MKDDEVIASKRRRKMKPRRKWKNYRRPGDGELLTREELARALGESPRTLRAFDGIVSHASFPVMARAARFPLF
jgi:hypothetical protein